ncbi:hypothetical protein [Burkholderia stagnalis]|uniref:hypothetical protein n=1 Tax=Burkholderia stagnalis TaxID=1503054 RepID=UPI0011CFDEA0|nr:hypothetical protein [Burkholderia stagnalis]
MQYLLDEAPLTRKKVARPLAASVSVELFEIPSSIDYHLASLVDLKGLPRLSNFGPTLSSA